MPSERDWYVNAKVNGKLYYITFVEIPDTDWVMISSVEESYIFKDLKQFIFIAVIIAVLAIVAMILLVLQVMYKMVSAPVTDLTNTITQVAGGDFCVEISEGRQDEIGQMKNSMRKYVGDMRETLCKVVN